MLRRSSNRQLCTGLDIACYKSRMPRIPYLATNFSGTFAPINTGNGEIQVTWAQIVWAAITAGKAAGDEYAYGIYSALERLHRASMMRAYLLEASSGFLCRTMPYQASDPSEKTSISFYLGMTLTKLFAEVLFGVPRVLHFVIYAQNYQTVAGQGESRPDLIGLSNGGDWYVFEAKGRSNGFDAQALATAKDQAEQIISIDNLSPVCSVACQAYFSPSGLSFRMDDSAAKRNDRSRTIKISRSDFVHAYGDPIRRVIELRGTKPIGYEGRRFRGARIEEAVLWVAVPDDDPTPPDESEADFVTTNQYLGGDQSINSSRIYLE